MNIDIGPRLKKLRNEAGLTIIEVCEALDQSGFKCSKEAIEKWEYGERMPKGDALLALANFYEVSVDYLLCRTDNEFTEENIYNIASTLGLSETAVINLKKISYKNGGVNSDILSDVLESPYFPALIDQLKKSNDGINRAIIGMSNISDKDKTRQKRAYEQFNDLAYMYVVKALRSSEDFIKEILGYNKLEIEYGNFDEQIDL